MSDGLQRAGDEWRLSATDIEAGYSADSRHLVLRRVSIRLGRGEFVALIGPNGSGKSSLIRALSRTLRPKSGAILLNSADLYTTTTSRTAALSIGVVPQETSLAFEYTVREVVAMGRAPHQPRFAIGGESADDRAAIDEALTRSDISAAFADRPISSLSGGERQRVLIARALAQQASILLLDEPTASLDIRHETELLSWLGVLAKREDRTVLAALHDLNLAAAYADRVVVLCEGRVYAEGSPNEVLTKETIGAVYGVDAWIGSHPATGRPYFLSMPPREPACDGGV